MRGGERVPVASTGPGFSCPCDRNGLSLERLQRQRLLRKWSPQQRLQEVGIGGAYSAPERAQARPGSGTLRTLSSVGPATLSATNHPRSLFHPAWPPTPSEAPWVRVELGPSKLPVSHRGRSRLAASRGLLGSRRAGFSATAVTPRLKTSHCNVGPACWLRLGLAVPGHAPSSGSRVRPGWSRQIGACCVRTKTPLQPFWKGSGASHGATTGSAAVFLAKLGGLAPI